MRRLLSAAAALLVLLSACARRETPADAGVRTGTLLLGNGAEPQDLDPQTSTAYNDWNILAALFEGLTCIDERTSEAVPGLAGRWDVSPDGLVYTFHLRPGLRWSNGDPLTADEFVYSYRRVLSPELASEYAYVLYALRNAEAFNAGKLADFGQVGVRAPDPLTVVLTLGAPCPYLPALVATPPWSPVHRAAIEAFGPPGRRGSAWTRPGNLVDDGPFVLREWTPHARVVVARNPRYWDDARNGLSAVVFYPTEDAQVDENAFRAGQLHVTFDLLPERVERYRREAPELLRVDPFSETRFLRFNVTRPPLADPRVRRALGLALDREAISRRVLFGSRPPARALTPPGTAGYTSRAGMPDDFAQARRLLAEAGFPGGRGFPRLEVQTFTDPINTHVLEAIQAMWRRELGIEVALAPEDLRVLLDNLHQLRYQAAFTRWVGDYDDPSTFLDQLRSDSGNNMTGWADPEFDRLDAAAARELDPGRRRALLQDAEARLLEQAPVVPIFHGSRTYLIRPEVHGWEPALIGIRRYQYVRLRRN